MLTPEEIQAILTADDLMINFSPDKTPEVAYRWKGKR